MAYTDDYKILQKKFNQNEYQIDIPELCLQIFNLNFSSTKYFCLPGVNEELIKGELEQSDLINGTSYSYKNPLLNSVFDVPDILVPENNNFNYILLKNPEKEIISNLILLFHGLNEKSWAKYIIWGSTLLKKNRKSRNSVPNYFSHEPLPGILEQSETDERGLY